MEFSKSTVIGLVMIICIKCFGNVHGTQNSMEVQLLNATSWKFTLLIEQNVLYWLIVLEYETTIMFMNNGTYLLFIHFAHKKLNSDPVVNLQFDWL